MHELCPHSDEPALLWLYEPCAEGAQAPVKAAGIGGEGAMPACNAMPQKAGVGARPAAPVVKEVIGCAGEIEDAVVEFHVDAGCRNALLQRPKAAHPPG